jgi:polar amino acid transport system substrate-binding protein
MRAPVLLVILALGGSAAAQDLRVVYNEAYPPFSSVGPSGLGGIEVDLAAEVGKRLGVPVTSTGLPWARAQLQVRSGEADAFITVATPERLTYALMSTEPVLTVRMAAATAKANPRLPELMKLKALEETFGYSQVNLLGSGWAQVHLTQSAVDYLASPEAVFRFLLAGRADIYLESDINLYYNSRLAGVEQRIQILPIRGESTELRFGISKRSPLASRMADVNRVIGELRADGTVDRILTAYGFPPKD